MRIYHWMQFFKSVTESLRRLKFNCQSQIRVRYADICSCLRGHKQPEFVHFYIGAGTALENCVSCLGAHAHSILTYHVTGFFINIHAVTFIHVQALRNEFVSAIYILTIKMHDSCSKFKKKPKNCNCDSGCYILLIFNKKNFKRIIRNY